MAHTVVEDKKHHESLSGLKNEESQGAIQPKSEDLRNTGERGSLMQVPKFEDLKRRDREAVSPSLRKEWGIHASCVLLFY